MKNLILIVIFFAIPFASFSQERIFSLGYGKTFVTNDSSTLSITFDINRMPGQTERTGGYYFLNDIIGSEGWGYYLKPTMDVNIGSSVSSSPNNISVGLPLGLVYDFEETEIGIFSFYIDGSPELVADKLFKNFLCYFSANAYLKYELNTNYALVNILAGLSNANGKRYQYELRTDNYGRFTIPIYLKLTCWNATTHDGRPYRRISLVNSFKFNSVYSDNMNLNEDDDYLFFNSKLDVYLTSNFGLNITYFTGNEEPIFRRNNSITFGVTLAR